MMRILGLIILISLVEWAAHASTPPVLYEGNNQLTFKLTEEEWARTSKKVYSFVTSRIADGDSNLPLRIRFTRIEGFFGYVPKDNSRTIYISSAIRSHIEFQLNLAHELVHILRHQANPNEEYWLDEALAKYVEIQYANDWPLNYQEAIAAKKAFEIPSDAKEFQVGGNGYAYTFFLFHYLYSHLGGDEFLRTLAKSHLSGWQAIEETALAMKTSGIISIPEKILNRQSLFTYFAYAMTLNDKFRAKYALFYVDSRLSAHLADRNSDIDVPGSPFGAFGVKVLRPVEISKFFRSFQLPDGRFLLVRLPQ